MRIRSKTNAVFTDPMLRPDASNCKHFDVNTGRELRGKKNHEAMTGTPPAGLAYVVWHKGLSRVTFKSFYIYHTKEIFDYED